MLKALLVGAGIAAVVLALLYLMQRSILFPMPSQKSPERLPDHVAKLDLNEGHAFFVRAGGETSSGKKPLLILAHGNAELAHWSIEPMSYFNRIGVHTLLLEYPGYGGSDGSPGRVSIEKSALEAFDLVAAMPEVDASRIIVYGRSIGGGPATLLASQRDAAALILESTFSSLTQLVSEKGFPSFLLRDRFDNAAIVSKLNIPVFLYHGLEDTLIPIEHSLRLQKLARDATMVTANCGHNDCPRPWAEITAFLEDKQILERASVDGSS